MKRRRGRPAERGLAEGGLAEGGPKGTKGKVRCPKCGRQLPPEAFGSNIAAPSGLQTYCRSCTREYQNARWKKKGRKEAKRRRGLLGPANVQCKRRTCLACGKRFMSGGPGNRRCERCTTALSGVVPMPACRVFI